MHTAPPHQPPSPGLPAPSPELQEPQEHESATARTRTPPEIKWLLNERAMLAGRMGALGKKIRQRNRIIEELQAKIAELGAQVISFEQQRTEIRARRSALDHTMQLINADINPAAGGTVNAWAERYGKRGALTEFVVNTLKAAGSTGMGAKDIALAANIHFGLGLTDPLEFAHYLKRTIHSCLYTLKLEGMVAPDRPGRGGSAPRLWRWRGEELPSLDEMLKMAGAVDADGVDGDDADGADAVINTA